MQILDSIQLDYRGQPRTIDLIHGDLTALPASDPADVLVISAFPGSYGPYPHTMMEALLKKGISVAQLAENKGEDLRDSLSCWVSRELDQPGLGFKRILCFEAYQHGEPPEVVGDIFRSLAAVWGAADRPLRLAMPLVSTGNVGYPVAEILDPLLEAAIKQMQHGTPIERLQIVEISKENAIEMKGAFSIIKRRCQQSLANRYKYDLFISYCWKNADKADFIINELTKRKRGLRVFLDRRELNTGSAWQQSIYDALENCAQVVALYSPDYLQSKMCKEEFNIAMLRHRDTDGKVLFPIFLYSANLPYYMRNLQYHDCREADEQKLCQAMDDIIAKI